MEQKLPLSVLMSTPVGDVELNAAPFRVAGETFSSISVSHRRQEVTNPFVEGTYVVNSLRENLTTPLSVWVSGPTKSQLALSLDMLKSACDQSLFTVRVTVEDWVQNWQCFSSDYTVGLQREYLHATMALVDIQLNHHPGAKVWSNEASFLLTAMPPPVPVVP
jgi:hypothetical protein